MTAPAPPAEAMVAVKPPRPKRGSSKLFIAAMLVALAPLAWIGFTEWPALAKRIWVVTDDATIAQSGAKSVGASRDVVLVEIAREAQARDGFRPRREGELPSVEYINRKLAERGAKWRVSRIEGARTVTYEVS